MDNDPNQQPEPDNQDDVPKPSMLGLVVAFLPAAMLLGLNTFKLNISQGSLMIPCILSVGCCFVSSALLFPRRTALAIIAGLFLLVINGFIAFLFGCMATIHI
jgi:hypothetical protein